MSSTDRDKKLQRTRLVFTFIFTAVAAGISIFFGTMDARMGGFYAESTPLLMVGSLCGNLPGIIAVLITFIFRAFTDTTSAYRISLYLIAVLLTASATRHRVFRSIIKTLIFGILTAVIIGAVNGLVISVILSGHMSYDLLDDMIRSYAYALPESMGAGLLLWLIFRLLPDRILVYFPNGIYYLDENDPRYAEIAEEMEARRKEAMSTLSFRITRVIMLEAVLLSVSAAVFAIHLVSILNPGSGIGLYSVSSDNLAGNMMPSEGSVPPEEGAPPARPEGEMPPEPRPVGILGQRLEDSVSSNDIFNDDLHRNPFERGNNVNSRMAWAFSLRLIMILFTIGVVTAALANAYMQFSIARPIKKMSEAMQGFAFSDRNGSIGGTEELAAIKIHSRDEIEELYNALVKTVSDTEEYLERLREEDRIKNELEVARASSDAKSAFLSSMSHEIRTPINAVLGFDEMILMENKDPGIAEYARDIQSAGRTLLALINDILDFSKIEAGKMDIIPVQYELTSTINDVVSMTMSAANDKGLSFDVKVDPGTPHLLYGDEIRIKQCITNILSNAVKYTEKGGLSLEIGYEETEKDDADDSDCILLKVSVKDTGIGIRKEDMEKLFSAFDRLDQVRNRSIKGTGLGLSITKQLLESMGSRLEVESEYEKGSDFHFAVRQQVVTREEIGDLTEAFKKYIPKDDDAYKDDAFYAPKASILVTDDTENNLLVVTRLLKRTGIHIDTSDSGLKTLELVQKNKYDIIYLDHMMPGMDGIETLHRMKELGGSLNRTTPVIVLTANAVSGSREMYLKEGFTDYMTKPVSYLTLKESLKRYLPDDRKEERTPDTESYQGAEEEKAQNLELLSKIQGINIKEGVANTGDESTLIDVMRSFAAAAGDASDRIEKELDAMDIKNYTVHVHALKSSARLIGAEELSAMALKMEDAGNAYMKAEEAGDKEAASETLARIRAVTPELLSLYRSCSEKLSPVLIKNDEAAEAELPPVSRDELAEMLRGIKEFAEAFDMDTVDSVMKQIDGYRLPEDEKETVAELRKAVQNVDRDAILFLLSDRY